MHFTNIFKSDFVFPEKVCIIAPGLNGKGFYKKIPSDFYHFAVSKAVMSNEINPSAWMMNVITQDWFNDANINFKGIRIFRKKIFETSSNLLDAYNGYYFEPLTSTEEKLDADNEILPVSGLVRGGGSVAACAIQIACNFGAKEILLCGVDMSGDQYYDNTYNISKTHGEIWTYAVGLQKLINSLISRNIKISTLSPTKLRVDNYL